MASKTLEKNFNKLQQLPLIITAIAVLYLQKGKPATQKQESQNMTVAQTILAQLGGQRFIAMTGAKNLVSDGDALIFKIGRNAGNITCVKISYLPGSDLYHMRFIRVITRKAPDFGITIETVKEFDQVFWDQLQELFTEVTGLCTSL